MTLFELEKHPELAGKIRELARAIGHGQITLAEVGGFLPSELDGAYACACRYAEAGHLEQTTQICRTLLVLEPTSVRVCLLLGICQMRLSQYDNADRTFAAAHRIDPCRGDALIYRGEARLMSGKIRAGLQLIERGIATVGDDPEHHQSVARGKQLLQRFGG